ncbi:tetratricopeptide repeat protein [Alkaliflexus imshenetskii]|uniref:tetratricopeptide repeat protein n=1 Tax=Alkaliflexus imshenetskii TaxID=286730 RepID=UPI00047A0E51|nr:hypothetical protein [Alkaliflexus imshenetskii]
MKGLSFRLFIRFSVLGLILVSCGQQNQADLERLKSIDVVLTANNAEAALDSLALFDVTKLNKYNQTYYKLLSIIAEDKVYKNFENDSVATYLVDYFQREKTSENYLRSLIFQGIARYRITMPDSMVYTPLKKAEDLVMKFPDSYSLFAKSLLAYYLGAVNDVHGNQALAEAYYKDALKLANITGENNLMASASILLFWIKLFNNSKDEAQELLKSVRADNLSPDNLYDLVNAQAVLYLKSNQPDSAVVKYKELFPLSDKVPGKIFKSNIYYSISQAFELKGVKDSALFYLQQAIAHIADSSYQRRNYMMYHKLGNMSYSQGLYDLSADSYKKAYNLLLASVDDITEKKVLELEKQFNYSRVELAALKQKQRSQMIIIGICFLLFLMGFFVITYRLKLKENRQRLAKETLMRLQAETDIVLNKKEARQKEHLIALYHHLTRRHARTEERFEQLSYKYMKNNQPVHDEIQKELSELKNEFSAMLPELINDELFNSYIQLPASVSLTNVEKVILFLLYCQTPSNQIATLLTITAGNLRVKKLNLKRKLTGFGEDVENIDQILALF